MATYRTWRLELSGHKHTVELEETGRERMRILVDEQPVAEEAPYVPAPRYEFSVAGRPALLQLAGQQGLPQEYELEVAGQRHGRGVPASVQEMARSARLAEETADAQANARTRLMGFFLAVVGAAMALKSWQDITTEGSCNPEHLLLASVATPTGLAMLVLGGSGQQEEEDEDGTQPFSWKAKVIGGIAMAGGAIGAGILFGLR